MTRTTIYLVFLSCIIAGCTSREDVISHASQPTPLVVEDILAELSILKTATFVECRPLEGDRETYVFQYDGLRQPDYLKTFETELENLGWTSKGQRSVKAPEDSSKQQEKLFERNAIEMSYWTFESWGQYLIGITLPKQRGQG